MPTYSYSTRDGSLTIERFYPLGKQPPRVRVGGRVYVRNPVADHASVAPTPSISGEIDSLSMGVLRSQVAEAQAVADQLGCKGTRYNRDGTVSFASRSAKKRFMLRHGFWNNDPGYSDVSRDQALEARRNWRPVEEFAR